MLWILLTLRLARRLIESDSLPAQSGYRTAGQLRGGVMTRRDRSRCIASLIFAIMALLHIYRLFTHFQVVLGSHEIPMTVSYVAIVVAAVLAWGCLPRKQKLDLAHFRAAALDGPGRALADRAAGRADLVEHHEIGAPFVARHVARSDSRADC